MFHNFDPNLRTQEKAVEYQRALNAAKLDKVMLILLFYRIGFVLFIWCFLFVQTG